MNNAFQMFKNIFALKETGYIYKLAANLDIPEFYIFKQAINLAKPDLLNYAFVILFVLLLVLCFFIISRKNTVQLVTDERVLSNKFAMIIAAIFVWCIISFSQVSTFIYFNF